MEQFRLVSIGIAFCSMRTWMFDVNALIFITATAAYYGLLLARHGGLVQMQHVIKTVPVIVAGPICGSIVAGNLFVAAGFNEPTEIQAALCMLLLEAVALAAGYVWQKYRH